MGRYLFLAIVAAVQAIGSDSFDSLAPGELPAGWTAHSSRPETLFAVHAGGAFGSSHSLLIRNGDPGQRWGASLRRHVGAGRNTMSLEFSFAAGGSNGRTLRLTSLAGHEPWPTALNLVLDQGRLLQFVSDTRAWLPVVSGIEASPDADHPRWYRIRIVADDHAVAVWFSNSRDLPREPSAVVPAHVANFSRDTVAFGCDRGSRGGFVLIDDVEVKTGPAAGRVPESSITAADPFRLWSGPPIPEFQEDLPDLGAVTHVNVHDPADGRYTFLHGAAIIHHNGRFYADWANSPRDENSEEETLQGSRSADAMHWSGLEMMAGSEPGKNHSHGIFLSHAGTLWAFSARFGRLNTGVKFPGLEVEAFTLDESRDRWISRGICARDMWPYNEPVRMADGNWITGGQDSDGNPGVLISQGADFTHWQTVKIPAPEMPRGFGETTLFADRSSEEIVAIIRPGRGPVAWVSTSRDFGRTWTPARPGNFPIGISKMYAGVLSTGQRYLVANFPAAELPDRYTLAIAVGKPGDSMLSSLFRLRFGPPAIVYPGFAKGPQWSYPYAHEHEGKLYVVYSIGKEKCGLSMIPISALSAK